MTVPVDQRPTGTPGTAPRGPAGPANTQKPPPSSPKDRLADELDTAALLLRSIGVLRLPGMDPALRMQLAHGLAVAQRAVAGALDSGRDGEVAVGGGRSRPVRLRAGRPPLPGAGFDLPKAPGTQALMASLARRAD